MSRALVAWGVLLALLPGCHVSPSVEVLTPTAQIEMTIDGQKVAVVPMVMAKGRYFWEIRPAQGALRSAANARQAGLPADTYAFNLNFHPPKPDAGFPVGDGLPAEGGFSRLDDASILITGANPDTFFFEKTYDGNASYSRRDADGTYSTPLFFYQSSGHVIGKFQDTFQRASGGPEVKVVIEFQSPFPNYTTH